MPLSRTYTERIPPRSLNGIRSYFEIPKFYYAEKKRVIRTEAIHALMRQLVGLGVFQDEDDVRKEALTDYDVMLPPTE